MACKIVSLHSSSLRNKATRWKFVNLGGTNIRKRFDADALKYFFAEVHWTWWGTDYSVMWCWYYLVQGIYALLNSISSGVNKTPAFQLEQYHENQFKNIQKIVYVGAYSNFFIPPTSGWKCHLMPAEGTNIETKGFHLIYTEHGVDTQLFPLHTHTTCVPFRL